MRNNSATEAGSHDKCTYLLSFVSGGPARALCPIRFIDLNRHQQVLPGRLSDRAVARVVQKCVAVAGLDTSKFGGHSLRAGLATAAASAGVQECDIMRQTGHKSVMTVRKYIREGEFFRKNEAASVGL